MINPLYTWFMSPKNAYRFDVEQGTYLYSLTKLRASSTLCVRLQRAITGDQMDFGFDGNFVDLAAIDAWRSGEQVVVIKLYDQGDSNNDLTNLNADPIYLHTLTSGGSSNLGAHILCTANFLNIPSQINLFDVGRKRIELVYEYDLATNIFFFDSNITGNDNFLQSDIVFQISNLALRGGWYDQIDDTTGTRLGTFNQLGYATTGMPIKAEIEFVYTPSVSVQANAIMTRLTDNAQFTQAKIATTSILAETTFHYPVNRFGKNIKFTDIIIMP